MGAEVVLDDPDRLSDLLEKAKEGTLLPQELRQVAESLRHAPDSRTAYTKLHIVGRAMATEYEELVAAFLHRPDDPMLSKLALQILCGWWGLHDTYLERLKEFLTGVSWDEEEVVRLIAISEAGECLRRIPDRELLEKLLEISDDMAEDEENRSAAFAAMARGLGDEWTSFPEYGGHLSKANWRRDVLSRAYQRYVDME